MDEMIYDQLKKKLSVRHTLFTPFNSLFAPIFQRAMSNLFDIWNPSQKVMERNGLRFQFFALKKCIIAAAKKFLQIFFSICSLQLAVFSLPLAEVQCPNFLDIRKLWGKVMERNVLTFEHFCEQMV